MLAQVVWLWLLPLLSTLIGLAYAEQTVGAFVLQENFTTIAEYGFVQNGSVDIFMSAMPESASFRAYVCSEEGQPYLIEELKKSNCKLSHTKSCPSADAVMLRTAGLHVTVGNMSRYVVSVLVCSPIGVPGGVQAIVVNYSCLLTNPAPFHLYPASSSSSSSSSSPRSHLDSQLLPAVATEQVAGLLWAAAALVYLFTLRQHWRRAKLLQKFIVAYPIAKVAFAYYAGTFYSHYSEVGYFTASQWAGYWTFSILLKTSLALLLMTITACSTSLGSKVKFKDIATIIALLIGIVIVSALECSLELTQLSSLILWMVELVLYVLIVAFLLTGVTAGLSKTGSILRSVIRRNTSETRRRVRSSRNLREARLNSPSSAPHDNNNNNDSNNNDNHNDNHANEHVGDSTISSDQSGGNTVEATTMVHNNEVEPRPQESEFHPIDLHEREHESQGVAINANSSSAELAEGSLSPSQLTNLNSSIAYLLPYIWFTRFNLFASFKFVLLFWVFLQIVAFFINLVPGTGTTPLNWLSLMTGEILDFIIFAGVTYTFLMNSRYPFSDSMMMGGERPDRHRHRRRHRDPASDPLLPSSGDADAAGGDMEQSNQAGGGIDLDSDQEDDLELELDEHADNNAYTEAERRPSQSSSGLPSRGPGLDVQEDDDDDEDDEEEKLVARSASASLANK